MKTKDRKSTGRKSNSERRSTFERKSTSERKHTVERKSVPYKKSIPNRTSRDRKESDRVYKKKDLLESPDFQVKDEVKRIKSNQMVK